MATHLMHHPPHLSGWAETDDDCPRVPEAPPPRWPLAVEVLKEKETPPAYQYQPPEAQEQGV